MIFFSPMRQVTETLHPSATASLALSSFRTHRGTASQKVDPPLLFPERGRTPSSRQLRAESAAGDAHASRTRPAKCKEEVCLGETRRSTCLSDTVTSKPKDLIRHTAGFRQTNPLTALF